MSRKVEPGLWKLFDPTRGNLWMSCWNGQCQTTFHEQFARLWLAQAQSQSVTSEQPMRGYADGDPTSKP